MPVAMLTDVESSKIEAKSSDLPDQVLQRVICQPLPAVSTQTPLDQGKVVQELTRRVVDRGRTLLNGGFKTTPARSVLPVRSHQPSLDVLQHHPVRFVRRSEERRVGKEYRSR